MKDLSDQIHQLGKSLQPIYLLGILHVQAITPNTRDMGETEQTELQGQVKSLHGYEMTWPWVVFLGTVEAEEESRRLGLQTR